LVFVPENYEFEKQENSPDKFGILVFNPLSGISNGFYWLAILLSKWIIKIIC